MWLGISIDGDEIISREDLIKIKKHISCDDNVSWYFIKFMDYRYWEPFEDYKMCLINKNKIRFLFSVHACPQVYARDNGWYWLWLNWISISHYPEYKEYREKYIQQILEGINENPWCLRFYRFLWYNYYKHWESDKAISSFAYIIDNLGSRFPVETLNSLMILSTIYQERWDHIRSFYYIQIALDYYWKVSTDFEIKINHRLFDDLKTGNMNYC